MMTRLFALLFLAALLLPQSAMAQHKSDYLKKMEESEKEVELPEATKRLLEKAGHKDSLEWIEKEKAETGSITLLDATEAQKYIERQTNVNASLKDNIGTLDLRLGGFNEDLWNSYSKDNFYSDFKAFEDLKAYLPSTRGILIRTLTSITKKPGFLRNNEEFVIERVDALIKLGFVREAVTLYSATVPPLSAYSGRLHLTGAKSFLASNNFDMACLETDLIDSDSGFSDEEKEIYTIIDTLCSTHLKQPINDTLKERINESSLPILKEIVAIKESGNGTLDPTPLLTPSYDIVASFLLTLSEQNKLPVRVETILKQPLSKTARVSLMSNKLIGSKFRADIFRDVVYRNLLDTRVIKELFENEKSFAARLSADFFMNSDDEMPANIRFDNIKAQLIKNKNIASPLSEIYLKSAARIKPVETLGDKALFAVSYLYLNGEIDAAERWFKYIPEGQKPLEIKEYDDLQRQNQSFFIFPLAHWHQIMLKEYVAFDRSDAFSQENLVTTLLQGESNPDGSLKKASFNTSELSKNFDGETQKLVGRLDETSRKGDIGQIALLSALIVEKERRNRDVSSKDFLNLVNFVLHKIRESGLNDYALFLARDVLSDRIAGTYKD